MKKITIAVGTTSTQKINYLKEVLKELNLEVKIIPVDTESGISYQPKTSEETEKGSINRAKGAFKKEQKTDFSIGIEVGYHKYSNKGYEMFCWVTIVDKNGYQISNQSHKFILPRYHQEILDKDLYLGDNLDGYAKGQKSKDKIKKHIDDIVRYRKPFIENALKHALVRYIKQEDF